MTAPTHRISRGSDFTRTLNEGVRVATRDLVVHCRRNVELTTTGGPRLGLIVSKSVGNAVVRHRTARRLRAAFRQCLPQFPAVELMVVIRARPTVTGVKSTELADQLGGVLSHRRIRELVATDPRVAP